MIESRLVLGLCAAHMRQTHDALFLSCLFRSAHGENSLVIFASSTSVNEAGQGIKRGRSNPLRDVFEYQIHILLPTFHESTIWNPIYQYDPPKQSTGNPSSLKLDSMRSIEKKTDYPLLNSFLTASTPPYSVAPSGTNGIPSNQPTMSNAAISINRVSVFDVLNSIRSPCFCYVLRSYNLINIWK